jgi:hypothetical protein
MQEDDRLFITTFYLDMDRDTVANRFRLAEPKLEKNKIYWIPRYAFWEESAERDQDWVKHRLQDQPMPLYPSSPSA